MKQATFMQRLIAYTIDIVIVLLISSLIASGFSSKKLEKLEKNLQNTIEEYANGEITQTEYMQETEDITYEIEKNSIPINLVTLVVTIGYYVIFQFLNKGQSLGKKIMKIKIISQKGKSPSIIQMILRTLIINQVLQYIIIIVSIILFKQVLFTKIYYAMTLVNYGFIIITALMILYRKDRLGLHDIISKTQVVKEGK